MAASDEQKRRTDLRKKFQRSFDEEAVKAAGQQKKTEVERRRKKAEEDAAFFARQAESVAAGDTRERKRKDSDAEWRKNEESRRRELELFKERRAEEQKKFKDTKEKERVYEEKKHQYFESLHEAASRKAFAEKREFDLNRALEKDLESVDREAREAKLHAERECQLTKERAESDRLAERHRLEREENDAKANLYSLAARKREQIEGAGRSAISAAASLPASEKTKRAAAAKDDLRTKLSTLERDTETKKNELAAHYSALREAADREALRKRNDAEHALSLKLQEIETEKVQERSKLTTTREKERRKIT